MLLAIFEQRERDGSVGYRAKPLTSATSWLSINNKVTRLLVKMNVAFAWKIPCRQDICDF
jgi:hypothetical protein